MLLTRRTQYPCLFCQGPEITIHGDINPKTTLRSRGLAHHLTCLLGRPHPISEQVSLSPSYVSKPASWQCIPLKVAVTAQAVLPLLLTWETQSEFLALAWPSLSNRWCWESEPGNRSAVSLPLSVSLSNE